MLSNINIILDDKHKKINTVIKLNGIIINEPEVIASSLNFYFNRIPTTLSNNLNNNILNYLVDQIPEAENCQQTFPEITKFMANLNKVSSVARNDIPTTILKCNVNILSQILSNLINQSVAMGLFIKPLELKYYLYFKIKTNLT